VLGAEGLGVKGLVRTLHDCRQQGSAGDRILAGRDVDMAQVARHRRFDLVLGLLGFDHDEELALLDAPTRFDLPGDDAPLFHAHAELRHADRRRHAQPNS
jgi:hypothetical protein